MTKGIMIVHRFIKKFNCDACPDKDECFTLKAVSEGWMMFPKCPKSHQRELNR